MTQRSLLPSTVQGSKVGLVVGENSRLLQTQQSRELFMLVLVGCWCHHYLLSPPSLKIVLIQVTRGLVT